MTQRPREQRIYGGLTREVAEAAFDADRRKAEAVRWSVAAKRWDTSQPEPTLVVVYVPKGGAVVGEEEQRRARYVNVLVVAGVAVVLAVIALAFLLDLMSAGRVELRAEGFAISFPLDWASVTGEEVAAENAELFSECEELYGADDAGCLMLRHQRETDDVVIGGHEGRQEYCAVRLRGLGLDALSDHDELLREYGTEYFGSAVDPVVVDLPSGKALRADSALADGTDYTAYMLVGPESVFVLNCWGPEAPADRWRHIAETFEFLPSGG